MPIAQYVIYGTETCKHCVEAVRILTDLGIRFEKHDATDPVNLAFLKLQGFTKIPQIYRSKDGDEYTYIGGCDDLKAYLKVSL